MFHSVRLLATCSSPFVRRSPPAGRLPLEIPNRGHVLTIDHGWREVARTALDFVQRSLAAKDRPRAVGQGHAELGARHRVRQ
jgi:hypothetical protein